VVLLRGIWPNAWAARTGALGPGFPVGSAPPRGTGHPVVFLRDIPSSGWPARTRQPRKARRDQDFSAAETQQESEPLANCDHRSGGDDLPGETARRGSARRGGGVVLAASVLREAAAAPPLRQMGISTQTLIWAGRYRWWALCSGLERLLGPSVTAWLKYSSLYRNGFAYKLLQVFFLPKLSDL
jgi:hypothetical protein